jgi:hypothetical protein
MTRPRKHSSGGSNQRVLSNWNTNWPLSEQSVGTACSGSWPRGSLRLRSPGWSVSSQFNPVMRAR